MEEEKGGGKGELGNGMGWEERRRERGGKGIEGREGEGGGKCKVSMRKGGPDRGKKPSTSSHSTHFPAQAASTARSPPFQIQSPATPSAPCLRRPTNRPTERANQLNALLPRINCPIYSLHPQTHLPSLSPASPLRLAWHTKRSTINPVCYPALYCTQKKKMRSTTESLHRTILAEENERKCPTRPRLASLARSLTVPARYAGMLESSMQYAVG